MIDGDQHQLCQVFTNLLTNAFEALDGKGHIHVTATTTDRSARIRRSPVRTSPRRWSSWTWPTTGPGVPAELTDRIFDPFFTTKPQGSGLGLAIVRKIVDAHDGRIDVNSSPARDAVPRHAAGVERVELVQMKFRREGNRRWDEF